MALPLKKRRKQDAPLPLDLAVKRESQRPAEDSFSPRKVNIVIPKNPHHDVPLQSPVHSKTGPPSQLPPEFSALLPLLPAYNAIHAVTGSSYMASALLAKAAAEVGMAALRSLNPPSVLPGLLMPGASAARLPAPRVAQICPQVPRETKERPKDGPKTPHAKKPSLASPQNEFKPDFSRKPKNNGLYIPVDRRREANARERTRVHTIGAAFEEVRRLLPCHAYDQKMSKLSILRIACKYILLLGAMLDEDLTEEQSGYTVVECVEQLNDVVLMETRLKNPVVDDFTDNDDLLDKLTSGRKPFPVESFDSD